MARAQMVTHITLPVLGTVSEPRPDAFVRQYAHVYDAEVRQMFQSLHSPDIPPSRSQ